MLNVQNFLKDHSLDDLSSKYGIRIRKHQTHPNLVSLKYGQVDSPLGDPIVQECRGLILDTDNENSIVSYPYRKFFNAHEGHAATIDWSTARILTKRDGCFLRDERLQLWNGGTIEIGDIVNKNADPTLIGFDEKAGKIIPCKVIKRFRNSKKNNWIDIIISDNIIVPGGTLGNKLRVTSNHQIYANNRFMCAGDIQPGYTLLTPALHPSKSVMHYMKSSLLGDGCITRNGSGMRFQENHATKYKMDGFVKNVLGDTCLSSRNAISGYGSQMTQVNSKTYHSLCSLRNEWYPSGKKIVPNDLSWMDAFSFAKWYMDDGSLGHNKIQYQQDRALFATNGFSEEDVNRLSEKLKDTFGVSVSVYQRKGWNIRMNAGKNSSIDNFWKAIAPHVIEQLRYKLPEVYRTIPYVAYPKGTETYEVIYANVADIRRVPLGKLNKAEFPSGRVGYDIETTTHNYFAHGILVHNSICTLYNYNNTWYASTSGTPDGRTSVSSMFPKMAFESLFWDTFKSAKYELPNEGYCYMFELTSPYNRIIVPYKEAKLTLHGVRNLDSLSEEDPAEIGPQYGWDVVSSYNLDSLQAVIEACKELDPMQSEGFVVRDAKFNRVKVKGPRYVAIHHLKNELTPRRVLEAVRQGETAEILAYFPEFAEQFLDTKAKYDALLTDMEAEYTKVANIVDQKKFALAVADLPYKGIFFIVRKGVVSSLKEGLLHTNIDKLMELIEEV